MYVCVLFFGRFTCYYGESVFLKPLMMMVLLYMEGAYVVAKCIATLFVSLSVCLLLLYKYSVTCSSGSDGYVTKYGRHFTTELTSYYWWSFLYAYVRITTLPYMEI